MNKGRKVEKKVKEISNRKIPTVRNKKIRTNIRRLNLSIPNPPKIKKSSKISELITETTKSTHSLTHRRKRKPKPPPRKDLPGPQRIHLFCLFNGS